MQRPLCPACREAMSSAEIGLEGIWSCLYCEGAWIGPDQLSEVLQESNSPDGKSPDTPLERHSPDLTCPSCAKQSYYTTYAASVAADCCIDCRSMFFRKGVLREIAGRGNDAAHDAKAAESSAYLALYLIACLITGSF